MTTCIIGAGASGVTVAKSLRERGIEFDWFDKGSELGGMWRYQNDSGTSSAYRSLQIDTSSRSLAYPDFPVPAEWPDYLRHSQVLEYLESYARHFGVIDNLTGGCEVTEVRQAADGRWEVTTDPGGTRTYTSVVVANGHLSKPKWPSFPGEFDGNQLHSHDYRTPEEFNGKRVLVVGMGNSGCDIAVDLSRVAHQVYLSARRSAWILPKYLLGRPTDQWSGLLSRRLKLPTTASRSIVKIGAQLLIGDQQKFGVPKPPHKIHQAHGTVGQELLPYVAYDWIRVKPNIDSLRGTEVSFCDGTGAEVDAIIYATGYDVSFDFLSKATIDSMDGGARLYRRMVHPDLSGLFFAGLVQPVGPTIPLVEIQGRWIAKVLDGTVTLPGQDAMETEIAAHNRWVRDKLVDSERYRLEVDFREHAEQLRGDMAAPATPQAAPHR